MFNPDLSNYVGAIYILFQQIIYFVTFTYIVIDSSLPFFEADVPIILSLQRIFFSNIFSCYVNLEIINTITLE